MMSPSHFPSARGPLSPATLKPLRLHPVPVRQPDPGGFDPDHVASFLAGLTAQYEAGAGVFPSPLAAPRPVALRRPRLSP